MPNLAPIIGFIAIVAWLSNIISASVCGTVVILVITVVILVIVWDIVFTKMTYTLGFVSKAKYNELKKDYNKLSELSDTVTQALEEARDRLKRVDEEYYNAEEMELVRQAAKIEGQDAVFRAFAFDKVLFQEHLHNFLANEAAKQAKNKKRTKPNVNKRNEPAWYKVLGVERDASYEDAKAAYRQLCRKFHPDLPGGSEEKMKAINVAWSQAEASFGK